MSVLAVGSALLLSSPALLWRPLSHCSRHQDDGHRSGQCDCDAVIVTLTFPNGVHGGRVRLGGPEVWTPSHFDDAPAVELP
jgi:hypothetical protein